MLSVISTGCAISQRDTGLEGVAKEWSKAIRASQVIPIYPLTEDLQVGDVYVTDFATGEEPDSWLKDGYLPLPQLHARLSIPGKLFADEMYRDGQYGMVPNGQAYTRLPQLFQMNNGVTTAPSPSAPVAVAQPSTQTSAPRRDLQNWKQFAPQASFPSYTVKVGSSSGGSLGLPTQGIPVALGLLNSQSASASVSLEECYSYGLSNQLLHDLVKNQKAGGVLSPSNLIGYAPVWAANRKGEFRKRYRFLRVITRVYTVGRIRVSVADESQTGGEASAGLDQNLKLLGGSGDVATNMKKLLDALNYQDASDAKSTTQPAVNNPTTAPSPDNPLGIKLRFVNASNRSISLVEDFEKPLVIGYNAIDLPIGPSGKLGNVPIDTFEAVLLGKGGYIKLSTNISEWLLMVPDAPEKLVEWANSNKAWLERFDFGEYAKEPQKLVDLFGKGRGLAWLIMKAPIHQRPWKQLERKIVDDLLRVPPGFDHDDYGKPIAPADFIKNTQVQ